MHAGQVSQWWRRKGVVSVHPRSGPSVFPAASAGDRCSRTVDTVAPVAEEASSAYEATYRSVRSSNPNQASHEPALRAPPGSGATLPGRLRSRIQHDDPGFPRRVEPHRTPPSRRGRTRSLLWCVRVGAPEHCAICARSLPGARLGGEQSLAGRTPRWSRTWGRNFCSHLNRCMVQMRQSSRNTGLLRTLALPHWKGIGHVRIHCARSRRLPRTDPRR
jgi:hypothetical protein